jgi:hypothetical protein
MKRSILISVLTAGILGSVSAQDKLIAFCNITEATVGFQLGKTTQVNSLAEGDGQVEVAGYKVPSPRVNSSFGILVGKIFFFGPGIGYMYQPGDSDNPYQHHVSVFGHGRLHFAKGKLRPFLGLKGGYNHILPEDVISIYDSDAYTWDGVYAEPEIGIGIKLGNHALLNGALGYQFLNAWNRSEGLTSVEAFGPEIKDSYHRLLLTIGFSFY